SSMQFGRRNLEMETLIVEAGNGVADYHVGQFADRFTNDVVGFVDCAAGEVLGDLHGSGRILVKENTAFGVAGDLGCRSSASRAIGLLCPPDIADSCFAAE